MPGGPRPLDVLLQRLDHEDGPTSAHLDLGTTDRDAETERHVALGASIVAEEEFWTVLADPAGLPYCITDRDPATGELGLSQASSAGGPGGLRVRRRQAVQRLVRVEPARVRHHPELGGTEALGLAADARPSGSRTPTGTP